MDQLIAKAATLLEALPYVQRFRGETFVTKYGGSFMDSDDPATRSGCLLYTSPSPRDVEESRMPSSA